MKVILLTDIAKVGRKGEIKEVSNGLANNMLLPKKLAIIATRETEAKHLANQKDQTRAKEKHLQQSERDKAELEKRIFTVKVKVGDKGQIFSGIHEKDIAAAVFQKTKIRLEKHQFTDHHAIKTLGEHIINIKLGQGITAKTKINLEAL